MAGPPRSCDAIRRGLTGPHQPDAGAGAPGQEPPGGGVVVGIDLVIIRLISNGDVLAVVLWAEGGPNETVVHLKAHVALHPRGQRQN